MSELTGKELVREILLGLVLFNTIVVFVVSHKEDLKRIYNTLKKSNRKRN